jgi:hypothetical protein
MHAAYVNSFFDSFHPIVIIDYLLDTLVSGAFTTLNYKCEQMCQLCLQFFISCAGVLLYYSRESALSWYVFVSAKQWMFVDICIYYALCEREAFLTARSGSKYHFSTSSSCSCWLVSSLFSVITVIVIHLYSHSHTVIVIQSYSHTVIQSYSHTVIQSYSHTVIQSYSHTDIQSYSHTVIQS